MTYLDKIIAYESGELGNEGILELFSELIKTGQAWALQGSYGRMAQSLIDDNLITKTGWINWHRLHDLKENA